MRPSRSGGSVPHTAPSAPVAPVLTAEGGGEYVLNGVTNTAMWYLCYSSTGTAPFAAVDSGPGPSPLFFAADPSDGKLYCSVNPASTAPGPGDSNVVDGE
jgi:hypothetical protein